MRNLVNFVSILRSALFAAVALGLFVGNSIAAEKTLLLSGVNVTLEDVTADTEVYYTSMRLNRALNVWNVEVAIKNKSARELRGPFVLYVESFSGTAGIVQPDGTDNDGGIKAFFDLNNFVTNGVLTPNQKSAQRTLSLGIGSGTPQLVTRIYAATTPTAFSLGVTRSLNDVGQPLPDVIVEETGPQGTTTNSTDAALGMITLGRGTGNHTWKFSHQGYLPVWRTGVLQSNDVSVLPNPRLTAQGTNSLVFTPIAGGTLITTGLQINFGPGAFSQNTTSTVTRLTGQTLPAFLPLGWSPLQAFHLDLKSVPALPGNAIVTPWARILSSETAAFVHWNEITLNWEVLETAAGNTNLSFALPVAGFFAIVVPDNGTFAPPAAVVGQPLQGTIAPFSITTGLSALGTVTPSLSPASRNPDLVTASAEVTITNFNGPLPSGVVLRCEVSETYDLADDTRRVLPRYETFITAFQRPGDANQNTLVATFPVRPLLLLGGDELKQGNVQVDVMRPTSFGGGIFDDKGGQVTAGGVRILAGAGIFTNRLAINLRLLEGTNFLSVGGSNIVYAFELGVGELPEGKRLIPQFNPQTPNSFFVLARLLSRNGIFGLEPVERFSSDATGKLTSVEPATGERLAGITSGGQFLLLRVPAPQGLIHGLVRNVQNQTAAGLPLRVTGQSWLVFSGNGGVYRTIAPVGNLEIVATDLATGDSSAATVALSNWQTGAVLDVAVVAAGPRVTTISPANGSTNVVQVSSVTITFSKPLNVGSAIGNILLLGQSNQPVNATLNFNLKGNVATLLPTDPLMPSTIHVVWLSTNITDLAGYKLSGTNVFAFKTQSEVLDRGLGAELISHEPTNGIVYMHASQGMAEPGKPVILVNESSGATTTVLAQPDGSFSGTITATAEDFLSAVFVNGNGTRNTVPVNRQIFKDGSVGLFNGGGTVEVPSPNGPIQLIVEPGSIPNKTVLKAEYVAPTNYPATVTNTPPEGGKLVGAFKFSGHGDEVSQGIDISFPVKVEDLNLPSDVDPTNASFALVIAQQIQDPTTGETNTAYEIIDRMHYENGRLVTHSPPFMGLLMSAVITHEIIVYTALQASGGTIAVSGNVFAAKVTNPATQDYDEATKRFLPGAVITAVPPNLSVNVPGRIRPGTFYGTANGTNAHFAVIVPYYANGAVTLWATHPRFPGTTSLPFAVPALTPNERFLLGNILHPSSLIFPLQNGDELDDHQPPTLTFSHAPDSPQPGITNTLRVLSRDDGSRPNITVTVESVASLVLGTNVSVSDIGLTVTNREEVGLYGQRDTYEVTCPIAAKVEFKAISRDGSGNERSGLYAMIIGGQPSSVSNSIPIADPHDKTGPLVIRSVPSRGSHGLSPGQPIVLRFDEPVDRSVLTAPGALLLSPAAGQPELHLSPDQLELTVFYYNLIPDQDYTLTLTAEVKDISGNRLDQNPTVTGNDSFELPFHTAELPSASLPGLQQGGGVVIRGIYAYALERGANPGVFVYDLSNPTAPVKVSEFPLPLGYPRDLVLIPSYSFQRRTNSAPETKDLLAVVGGFVGQGRNQYLRIIDISDPLNPVRLAGVSVNFDPTAVVSRVQWSAPMLDYLENAALSAVHEVNLQEMIIGEYLTLDDYEELPEQGRIGIDANGDGDFVDEGDQLPLPPRVSPDFAGKSGIYSLGETDQFIDDFAMGHGGDFLGVVVDAGKNLTDNTPVPAAYRTLTDDGRMLIREAASYEFTNARPKRVSLLLDYPMNKNGQIIPTHFAMVSIRMNPEAEAGKPNRIVVLDVTDPEDPQLLTEIAIPAGNGDSVYGVALRPDGLLMAATDKDILLLDPARFNAPLSTDENAPHPAIVGVIPNAGDAMRTFDSDLSGLNVVSLGGKNMVLQSSPRIEVVSFPDTTPFNPRDLVNTTRTNIEARFSYLRFPSILPPARFKGEPGIADSTLTPPDGHNHFYAIVHAPGSAGETIELALESLNWAGHPLPKKGFLFPPVNALSSSALAGLGQTPHSTDAPTRSCRAWRLSHNPASPYYNLYLSRPFALVTEEMSTADLASVLNDFDREVLWSGDYLRISLDPSMADNPVLGPYAGKIDGREKLNLPGVETVMPTHAADYLQSRNPGPVTGGTTLPSAMSALNAYNGEMNINLECMNLPGRRLPIIFRMNYSGQSLYEGPFARGWDFNYNQRIEELNEVAFPVGTKVPLVMRDTAEDSEIAQSKDLIFHTGAGRKVIFRYSGTNPPPEIAADPLVAELGWTNSAARYYLPPDGLFNFFVKFKDGRFARLDTDGTQHWYNPAGRLMKVYDRYPENSIELVYNRRGELIQIKDELRRAVDIGYWRTQSDSEFRSGIDQIAGRAVELGKICRLADYTKRDILFYYNDQGLLERREGPKVETATPGSFTGRAITRFIYSGSDRPGVTGQTLIGMIGADETGTPAVNATDMGSKGRDAIDKFKVANKELTLEMSYQNTARGLADGNGTVQVTTGDQSKIKHTFDKFGRVLTTEFTGTNGAPRQNTATYYPNGLMRSMTYPEGNSILYVYDTNNASLRSRGNLTMVIKSPGPRGGPTLTANTQFDPWYNLAAGTKTDFNGVEATITLYPDHRDTQEIRIDGLSEKFERNEFGLQTKYIGIDGTEQGWTYNDDGFIETTTSGSGSAQLTSHYKYQSLGGAASDQTKRGLPSSIEDPKGVPTTLVYDEKNLLVSITRAGVTTTHSYDSSANEIETSTTVDTNLKLVEKSGYNQLGFMTNHTVKDLEIEEGIVDKVTTTTPDDLNRVKELILPSGDHHRLTYDHMGNIISYEIVGSYIETYTYDLNGNRKSKTINGATETYEYDGHDRLIKVTTPTGSTEETSYDNNGNPLEVTLRDPEGVLLSRSVTTYDDLNRPKTVTQDRDGGQSVLQYDYNAAQRSATITDPLGAKTVVIYDQAGRAASVFTPTQTNYFHYDLNDNLEREETDENGVLYTARWERNERDHVTSEFDNLGRATIFGVRLDGANTSIQDREGHATSRQLSRIGEVLTETGPNNVVKRFVIATNGLVSSVKDTAFNGVDYTYSPDGRLLETRLPNNGLITYSEFNALSLPQKIELPRGVTIATTYSPIGKTLTRKVTGIGPARNETYGYDGMQRLKSLTDPSGTMEVDFDLNGAVKETRRSYILAGNPSGLNNLAFAIKQTFDAGGNVKTQTYPNDSVTVTQRRDINGRLVGLDPAPGETALKDTVYAGDIRIGERVLGDNRIRMVNAFDPIRRVMARRYTKISDGQLLADVRYGFDKNGAQVARQYIHRGGRADFFGYDAGYRLTRVDQDVRPRLSGAAEPNRFLPNFAQPTYVEGTWKSGRFAREATYTTTDVLQSLTLFNPDNLAVSPMGTNYESPDIFRHVPVIDGFSRTRDEVGNVTKTRLAVRILNQIAPELVEATFTYNDLGQLTKVTRADGVEIINDYDMAGLRIRRRVTGSVVRCVPSDIAYIYDGAKLIEERDLADGAKVIARYYYGDDGDELVAGDLAVEGNTNLVRRYFLTDVMKSVLAVTDEEGTVIERANYDAWGQPILQAADHQLPVVSRVINETNSLLVVFSEPVLPSFATTPSGSNIVTTLRDLANAFELRAGSQELALTVSFEENMPGYPFGCVYRLHASQALSGTLDLTVQAGVLQDEWNNTNAVQSISFSANGTNALLYAGPAPGSTAPVVLSRSVSTMLFHGQVFDFDAGLLYCRARYYDPTIGMFLQRDPAGYEDSVNQYAGFANNPINYRDPTGTFAWDPDSWGRALSEIGGQASMKEDGLSGYMVGSAISFCGAVLQLGTATAEGWDLLNSDAQGTFGLLDRIRGAKLVASDAAVAMGAATSMYSVFSGITGRVRGYISDRRQWREFGHNNGLTGMELDANRLAMEEMSDIHKARSVEAGTRRFKKPVQRRQNAERLMANKPGHVLEKTGSDGWVYKDGKFYNSDADQAYLEIDGRPATLAQQEQFNSLVKKHYENLYRKAGYKGTPSCPIQHGMHDRYPDAYGQVVNTHLVDYEKLKKVGHPGDVFALKLENGRMSGFHKSRWEMHNKLLETNQRFMQKAGKRLPEEWTQMSLHPTIGSIKDAAAAGKVFTPGR